MSETNTPVPDVEGQRNHLALAMQANHQKNETERLLIAAREEIARLRKALGQISRMKLSYDRAINQTTLSAAITIARRQALGDSHG